MSPLQYHNSIQQALNAGKSVSFKARGMYNMEGRIMPIEAVTAIINRGNAQAVKFVKSPALFAQTQEEEPTTSVAKKVEVPPKKKK